MTALVDLPVFPLGTVLFPGALLPCQVFEPRYVELLRDVGGQGGHFGVTLITAGQEVGEVHADPDRARARIGTRAKIVDLERRGPTTSILLQGEQRFRVHQWLDDDPYPRATVTLGPGAEPETPSASSLERTVQAVVDLLELVRGERIALPEMPDSGEGRQRLASQLCATAPLGAYDKQTLLECEPLHDRLDRLHSLVSVEREFLVRQHEADS